MEVFVATHRVVDSFRLPATGRRRDSAEAKKKVQVLGLLELFYGSYFCVEQHTRWYDLTERVPDGPFVASVLACTAGIHPENLTSAGHRDDLIRSIDLKR